MRSIKLFLFVLCCATVSGAFSQAFGAVEAPDTVLTGYAAASTQSDLQLRGASMNVNITASVPRLEKTASLQGVRKVSTAGDVSYDSLKLTGDQSVRREVIARYLAAEENLGHEHDLKVLALTPANYKFRYLHAETLDGHDAYVFSVRPRHKYEGSFQGDLWIDARTYLPLRESGRVVQHSIFLRRLTMVRKFRIVDSMAIPESTEISIETRLVGKAQMSVRLHDVSRVTEQAADGGNVSNLTTVQ